MKASYSFPFLFLLAAACSDAPTAPTAVAGRTPSTGSALGEPPPPPVDAAVVVCVGSACAVFDGEYFSQGSGVALTASLSAANAQASNSGVCTFPGSAWLKIDNRPGTLNYSPDASGNAHIKCSHQMAKGGGTLEFYPTTDVEVVVLLDQVRLFNNTPTCAVFCADFIADVTVNDILVPNGAQGFAFNRDVYNQFCGDEPGGERFCDPRNFIEGPGIP